MIVWGTCPMCPRILRHFHHLRESSKTCKRCQRWFWLTFVQQNLKIPFTSRYSPRRTVSSLSLFAVLGCVAWTSRAPRSCKSSSHNLVLCPPTIEPEAPIICGVSTTVDSTDISLRVVLNSWGPGLDGGRYLGSYSNSVVYCDPTSAWRLADTDVSWVTILLRTGNANSSSRSSITGYSGDHPSKNTGWYEPT